jgi:hypothetical protein
MTNISGKDMKKMVLEEQESKEEFILCKKYLKDKVA